jgi:hypothetical protein
MLRAAYFDLERGAAKVENLLYALCADGPPEILCHHQRQAIGLRVWTWALFMRITAAQRCDKTAG